MRIEWLNATEQRTTDRGGKSRKDEKGKLHR